MPDSLTDEKLIRGIGRFDLTAIVINTIIGAGIFGLPSKAYALIGTYSLWAFVACALIISLIVLCYAEVATRFSSTGGPYLYAREAFGPAIAFEVGWLYWIVRVTTFAANCNLLLTYAGFFWPPLNSGAARITAIAVVIGMLATANMVGVRSTAVLTNFFTVGKLIPLLVFILIGLFYLHPQSFTYGETPHYTSFGSAILILLYAFVGFEVAVIPAGEAKDPHRDFPFALLVGLAIVAVIYVVVQIVCVGTLPQLASSERPITDAASNFLGPVGAGLITAGALISILGNLNVGMLAGSRILYAMAARSELPRQLAAIHPRFHTPYVAVIFNSLVIGVLTIYSSFLSALAVATVTRLLIYATTCVALPVFRRRTDIHEAGFRLPFGLLIPLLSLGLIVWLLTNVDFTKEGLPIIVATVAGFVLFWVAKVFRKS